MKRLLLFITLSTSALSAQSGDGELRLNVIDPSGLGVRASVEIVSAANQYRRTLATDEEGKIVARRLPFGVYQVSIRKSGFADASETVEIRSALPTDYTINLTLPTVNASVIVAEGNTLIDPDHPGSINQIGADTIQNRASSVPGRSVQDLVNSQPGWL